MWGCVFLGAIEHFNVVIPVGNSQSNGVDGGISDMLLGVFSLNLFDFDCDLFRQCVSMLRERLSASCVLNVE